MNCTWWFGLDSSISANQETAHTFWSFEPDSGQEPILSWLPLEIIVSRRRFRRLADHV